MKDQDAQAFASLFRDVYRKCFAGELATPLTESESIHLSVAIEEDTGLEIGWKSLKNYSQHVLGVSPARPENPSTRTLDTLARYVAGAPSTDPARPARGRERERHYPYWFRYQEVFQSTHRPSSRHPASARPPDDRRPRRAATKIVIALGTTLVAVGFLTLAFLTVANRPDGTAATFLDEFDDVSDAALAARGWRVVTMDSAYWAERAATAGYLTLFTLRGDNWPQAGAAPMIKNLLVRVAPAECFGAEVRFMGFYPKENWQQAGILLLEDTAFAGKSLRLSIGYNDYAGGFPETAEILVQAITSLGRTSPNPEEIVHHQLFVVKPGTEALVGRNLEHAALRIEKRGSRLRLLSSTGPMTNAAFKEVISTEFPMRASYIGVFALKGFVEEPGELPVQVDRFRLAGQSCDD